jgi:hypothetical protein
MSFPVVISLTDLKTDPSGLIEECLRTGTDRFILRKGILEAVLMSSRSYWATMGTLNLPFDPSTFRSISTSRLKINPGKEIDRLCEERLPLYITRHNRVDAVLVPMNLYRDWTKRLSSLAPGKTPGYRDVSTEDRRAMAKRFTMAAEICDGSLELGNALAEALVTQGNHPKERLD